MKQYHDALQYILDNGESVDDRTGVGTKSVFGYQMRFNLQEGFPAVTTKKLAWRAVVGELLWFLEGSGDERRLAEITHGSKDGKVTIWTPNALAPYWKPKAKYEGDLGRVYGVQWRKWRTPVEHKEERFKDDFGNIYNRGSLLRIKETDQLVNLIEGIKTDPDGRRHILTAWNPGELDLMALPPCHAMSQFRVMNGKLSYQLYQRSADMFLGVPFNIASYALLTHMLAQICDLKVGDFIHTIGDAHIYNNHMTQVKEQLERKPMDHPTLEMPQFTSLEELLNTKPSDYKLLNYTPMDSIKAPMAV